MSTLSQNKSLQIPEEKEFQDLCLTVVCFNDVLMNGIWFNGAPIEH